MTEKQAIENITKPILMIALVIMIILILLNANKIYAGIAEKLSPSKMPEDVEKTVTENFDKLTESLEGCATLEDYECICPEWPVFPAGMTIKMNNDGEVTLYYKGKKYLSKTLDPIAMFGVVQSLTASGIGVEIEKIFTQEIEVTFPSDTLLDATNDAGKLVVDDNVVFSKYFFKDFDEDLDSITYMKAKLRDRDPGEMAKEIGKFPLCLNKRQEAIESLDTFAQKFALIQTDNSFTILTITLAEDYSFYFSQDSITLYNEKNAITRLKENEQPKDFYNVVTAKKEIQNLLCSNSKKDVFLSNGESVSIDTENGKKCLVIGQTQGTDAPDIPSINEIIPLKAWPVINTGTGPKSKPETSTGALFNSKLFIGQRDLSNIPQSEWENPFEGVYSIASGKVKEIGTRTIDGVSYDIILVEYAQNLYGLYYKENGQGVYFEPIVQIRQEVSENQPIAKVKGNPDVYDIYFGMYKSEIINSENSLEILCLFSKEVLAAQKGWDINKAETFLKSADCTQQNSDVGIVG